MLSEAARQIAGRQILLAIGVSALQTDSEASVVITGVVNEYLAHLAYFKALERLREEL